MRAQPRTPSRVASLGGPLELLLLTRQGGVNLILHRRHPFGVVAGVKREHPRPSLLSAGATISAIPPTRRGSCRAKELPSRSDNAGREAFHDRVLGALGRFARILDRRTLENEAAAVRKPGRPPP